MMHNPRARIQMDWLVFGLSLWGTLWMIDVTYAHEGHQPLPTKGVQVDVATGRVVLSNQARQAIGVRTTEVFAKSVEESIEAYAETTLPWNAYAFVSAQLSGRILRLHVKPGDTVRKGQVLAELSSRELELLKYEYEKARNEEQVSRKILESTRPAAATGSIPLRRLMDLENALEQSQASLTMIRARASMIDVSLENLELANLPTVYKVMATIDGTVLHNDLAEGKYVEADEHLFEIADSRILWAKIKVLEKDLFRVKVGQQVTFHGLGLANSTDAKIDFLDVSLDPVTKNAWAWSKLSSPSMMPGEIGNAIIQVGKQERKVVVPQSSVYSDGIHNYVFVEEASKNEGSEYRKRNVRLSDRRALESHEIEMLVGSVFPGDRVVIQGGHELSSLFFLESLQLGEKTRKSLGIELGKVEIQPFQPTWKIPGVVGLPPESRATVTAQIKANVRAIHVLPGTVVQQGDVLLELFGSDLQAMQLELLQNSLNAQLLRGRVRLLESAGSDTVPLRTLVEERGAADLAESRMDYTKKQLQVLGVSESEIATTVLDKKLSKTLVVRSPIHGAVARLNCVLGQTVAGNQTLLEIQNLDATWIEAKVQIDEADRIEPEAEGTTQLLANPEIHFPTRIVRRSPTIEEATRTRTHWLEILKAPKDTLLRQGMMVTVLQPMDGTRHVLAVPRTALVRDGMNWFVFAEKDPDRFERRRVSIGKANADRVEILSGLQDGETIVIQGAPRLQSAFSALR